MLIARLGEEGISPVHQLAVHVLVGILDLGQHRHLLLLDHANDEEDVLVSLHQRDDLVHQGLGPVALVLLSHLILLLNFRLAFGVMMPGAIVNPGIASLLLLLFLDFNHQILNGIGPKVTIEVGKLCDICHIVVFGLKGVVLKTVQGTVS